MPIFKYVAKDSEGQTLKGVVEASSPERAAAVMRERNLVPVSVVAKKQVLDVAGWLRDIRGVGGKEVIAFTRQLATMVGAGLPLAQALAILRDQAGDTPFGDIHVKELFTDIFHAVVIICKYRYFSKFYFILHYKTM